MLREVVTGAEPQQRTEVRVTWAGEELRIAFEAEDREPWATLTARDAPLYTEEVVEVFLDPVGDLAAYFEIEVNPLGAVLDLLIRRTRRGLLKDIRWQCEGLRARAAKTESGWMAELAIPSASIAPEPPMPGSRWRANFCRIDRPRGKPRELSAWSPTGVALFHVPERFGWLEFR
jgi:hypothetical protein